MAYLPESELEKERRRQQGDASSAPQSTGGPSGVINAGTGAAAPGQNKGPTSSGAFVGINNYLDANRDQGATLANNIAGKIRDEANEAKTTLGNVQNQFNQQVEQNTVKRNEGLVKEAVSNPTGFVSDANKLGDFTRIRDAIYQGPKQLNELDGYANAQSAIEKADSDVQNTKSEQGRFTLLQQQNNKPTYSHGQQRLDQAILQNNPESKNSFANVQNEFSGIKGMLGTAQQMAAQQAQGAQQETLQAKQDAHNALGRIDDPNTPQNEAAGAMGTFQTDLQKRMDAYKAQQQELLSRTQRTLGNGGEVGINPGGTTDMDADIMALLGLRDGQNIYNVNLSSLAPTFNAGGVNERTFANADDYAKYQALAQLAGEDASYLYDKNMAGTAQGVQFDQSHLQGQIEAAAKSKDALVKNELPNALRGMGNIYGDSRMMNSWSPHGLQARPLKTVEDALAAYDNIMDVDQRMGTLKNGRTFAQDLREAAARGGTNGASFQMLENFVKAYRALQPSRAVTKRS